MVFAVCSGLSLGAAAVAAFSGDIRHAILALWVTGLAVGGLFLSLGAELLAIIQWIVSTVVAISFVFYAVTFGEFGVQDARPRMKRITSLVASLGIGGLFSYMIGIGTQSLVPPPSTGATVAGKSYISILGQKLAEEHLLSLEVLALTLLVVIIGSGVVARPEVIDS